VLREVNEVLEVRVEQRTADLANANELLRLEIHNYRALTAHNGIEAIDLYTQYHNEISGILIDMRMPAMVAVQPSQRSSGLTLKFM
jgi:CheY-like chemotaxis protein